MEVMIDKFGRIAIPKIVREHLGLKPGMVVEVEEQDQEVVLKPVSKLYVKNKQNVLVFTGKAVEDLEDVVKKARNERIKKLGDLE